MSGPRAAEKEIDLLERQREETDDPEERREIDRAIRDIERELDDQERWLDEGFDRGWL